MINMLHAHETTKKKIPTGLSAVSNIFFASGVMLFARNVLLVGLLVYSSGFDGTDIVTMWLITGMAFGLLFVGVSSGLRRCSRGWRTCALTLIWIGIIAIVSESFRLVAAQFQVAAHKLTTELSTKTLLLLLAGLLFEMWQLRVLTRPDVCEWFYDES